MDYLMLFLLLIPTSLSLARELTHQQRLLSDILVNYTTDLRPVINHTTTNHVTMDLAVSHLIDVDLKTQSMKFLGWLIVLWHDEFLQWDPEDYGGIDKIRISTEKIWKPDIVLYNSVDDEHHMTEVFPETQAMIFYNGNALWDVPARLTSRCKVKLSNYPFDQQKCSLKFVSWSYDSAQINLTTMRDHARLVDYIQNSQWDIIELKANTNLVKYEISEHPWSNVIYTFVIQRRVFFYVFYLIIPTILFIIIGVMVFILPPQSDEKVSLAVTLLLAMLVFLLIVFENIPHTDDIPFLGGFFGSVIILLSITSMMSIIVETCSDGSLVGARPPSWVRVAILVWMGHIFGMGESIKMALGEQYQEDIQKASQKKKGSTVLRIKDESRKKEHNNVKSYLHAIEEAEVTSEGDSGHRHDEMTPLALRSTLSEGGPTENPKLQEMCHILQGIYEEFHQWQRDYKEQKTKEDKLELAQKEWVLVAMVIDRICLVFFGILGVALMIWVVLYGILF